MPNVTPRYTRRNVLRGQAQVWLRPFDPAITDYTTLLVDDDLPINGDWQAVPTGGSPLWKPIGATSGGVTMRFTRETTDITVEEQVNPVDVATNSLDPRIEATLAEDTLQTMLWAYGGGSIDTVAATVSEYGYSDLTISDELDHLMLGLEGVNDQGLPRRVIWPDVLSVAEVETAYRRSETQRLYAVSFRMVNPLSDMIIHNIDAAPTGSS
ncbi:MAG: hypothetical protein PHQ41_02335 [Candidatus Cloacimonetes bacterium]|nr:hypothetical protein [Candidatus Cloacimonadota bacterium]